MDPNEYYSLYYVVKISSVSNGKVSNERSELYTYNCKTKKAKKIAAMNDIDKTPEDYYEIDTLVGNSLIVSLREPALVY
jgi:hypothetical protein